MKLVMLAVAAMGVFGAAHLIGWAQGGGNETVLSKSARQKNEALLSYKLRVSGQVGNCTVVKKGVAAAARAELELEESCIALMPRLAEAHYWQEAATGEVTFVSADGRPIVEFFAADGVAYESMRPISPLVALTAQ